MPLRANKVYMLRLQRDALTFSGVLPLCDNARRLYLVGRSIDAARIFVDVKS